MCVTLISEVDFYSIQNQTILAETDPYKLQNNNLNFSEGFWVPSKIIIEANLNIAELAKVDNLPIFFGTGNIQHGDMYKQFLTAHCIARQDGSNIRAVSYLEPYSDYSFCRDFGRCFRLGINGDFSHYWRVIGHSGDAKWLAGYWGEETPFDKWVNSLEIQWSHEIV